MQLPTAIVEYSSHTLAVCSCHTLSIVTTTCSILTDCSKDASTTMPSHQDRTGSNRIPPAKQPPKHQCVPTVIKVKSESNVNPASRPATRASLSRCQPRPMCSSSFRLAFHRCRVPAVAFVQQRDHADAGAGAKRTTITSAVNTIQRLNGCTSIDCNRRIRVAHSRRMLLPHAQHRHDDVQRRHAR